MKIPWFIVYILVSILWWLVKELNTEEILCKKKLFITTTTSILIWIIFWLLTERITKDSKIAIAIAALAGVRWYDSIKFATDKFKKIVKKKDL